MVQHHIGDGKTTPAGKAPVPFETLEPRIGPTQRVREELLDAIQRGDYRPGSKLPSERALSEAFGVSRVSVREALAKIEAAGLIEIKQGKGAVVLEQASDHYAAQVGTYLVSNRHDLVELFSIRNALEQLAADRAATHGTEEGLARMLAAHQAFTEAVESESNVETAAALDIQFHLSIALASGAGLLHSLLSGLNQVLSESRQITMARPGQLARSLREHQTIVAAITGGQAAAASRAIDKHITGVSDWIAKAETDDLSVASFNKPGEYSARESAAANEN